MLGNCLPGTPYEKVVEHAVQHESAREWELSEKKNCKRKHDDLDEVREVGEESNARKKKTFSSQAIQSIKDQLHSLTDKIESRFRSDRDTSLSYTGQKLNVCLHCAKPNHRYYDCRTANTNDKDDITCQLRDKQFDFNKLRERAESYLKNRRSQTTEYRDSPF